jgi:hypothetical protein
VAAVAMVGLRHKAKATDAPANVFIRNCIIYSLCFERGLYSRC